MANPQPDDPHLRMAHQINEQVMVSQFTEQQRRILDLILRLSWGCGKKYAMIPQQKDFELVGVRQGHVKAHLDWLADARVIERDGDRYSFNKDFDQWRVSRALAFTPKKLTELVSLNLDGTYGKRKKGLTENGSGVATKLATSKETSKESSSIVEELQKEFPDKDVPYQWKKCVDWWEDKGRKMKSPRTALRNWLEKAPDKPRQASDKHDPAAFERYAHLMSRNFNFRCTAEGCDCTRTITQRNDPSKQAQECPECHQQSFVWEVE